MKQKLNFTLVLLSLLFFSQCNFRSPECKRLHENILLSDDWKFYRGDAEGAQNSSFEDTAWRTVDLPHDWSIEDLPGTNSPFDSAAISGVSGGFTTGGTGWYRKTLSIAASDIGKPFYLLFEGIYMNSDVWLNGEHLGNYPYGYSSFWYEITDKVKAGNNTLAVRVKNEGKNSRWYAGSGIYRHVWLRKVERAHVAPWGTYVTTPTVNKDAATINIKTHVLNKENEAQIRLLTTIIDRNGKKVGEILSENVFGADGSFVFDQSIAIKSPALWSTNDPALYTAVSEVYIKGKLVDKIETEFGIRTISFDAKNGFLLNGEKVLLKGGCVHHDNGPLGAKAYDRAEERKVELLKASGYNAIRTSHNPPSPAFLRACDRLGMLVIDEAFDTWTEKKNKQDYHLYFNDWWRKDVENMILRDRNHPSIIMWSTGNEIPNRHKPEVAEVSKKLTAFIKSLDSSRPVTSGVNGVAEDKDFLFSTIDVAGYNYDPDKYVPDHERVPERVIYASESFPIEAFKYWEAAEKHPWVIGDFVWTAWDYIGEASIGWLGYPQKREFFPWNLAYCGDIDICGWKRPQSYYRDALWMPQPVLSVFVKAPIPTFAQANLNKEPWSKWEWDDVVADWNWQGHEDKSLEVHVYSSCDSVELFLNDKSLGKKATSKAEEYKTVWQVPYQKGALKAVGHKKGHQPVIFELKTAGEPSRIVLKADRSKIKADNQDLSYITVELTDAAGNRNPKAENLIHFEIEGTGSIVAVGNANPTSTESYSDPKRKLWQGRALVIVKSGQEPGKIVLKASAEGFETKEIVVECE